MERAFNQPSPWTLSEALSLPLWGLSSKSGVRPFPAPLRPMASPKTPIFVSCASIPELGDQPHVKLLILHINNYSIGYSRIQTFLTHKDRKVCRRIETFLWIMEGGATSHVGFTTTFCCQKLVWRAERLMRSCSSARWMGSPTISSTSWSLRQNQKSGRAVERLSTRRG